MLTTEQFMFQDRHGHKHGPYRAIHAEGPWYCMAPEGVDVPPAVLRSGGLVHMGDVVRDHLDTLRRVGWALDRSLRVGVDERGIGWLHVES